ncbi:MAG TPA: hypothetical protein DCL43_03015 [Chitinophagaceae bacterium]|nr:hypothetical protein [Chitinophagaceae bacterium]HAN38354.1 hypothetical protein [Chitinophagaceae bacterium]
MDIQDFLATICLQLPATVSSIKFEHHIAYTVGGKIFCITDPDMACSVSLKCNPEKFDELTQHNGVTQAPYFARGQWIHIEQLQSFTVREWQLLVTESYQLVVQKLTKSQKLALGIG